ncbi:MAG: VIT1/CCC1 transporter family protein [Methyloceanibacter sp.]
MEDVLERWESEKTAAYLSGAVAANESDPKRAKLFRNMADAAEEQAAILAKDLKQVPSFTPSMRSRIMVFLLGILPPRAMRNALSAHKVRGISVYRSRTEEPKPEAEDTAKHAWPTSVKDIGRQHKNYTSGMLRAGVFGVNDGLVSNTCLVMGVAGAGVGPSEILLTGIAGLLAGAFSGFAIRCFALSRASLIGIPRAS